MKPSVQYLGHVIDKNGLHPLPDKIQAIQEAPTSQSVHELKSYLGMENVYQNYLLLYRLLRKDYPWTWDREEERAFNKSTSTKFLAHFDSNLLLTLACDASAYIIGAVLAHKMPDGTEKPIGYASRTLSSQLEKEGLSCVFGIKKFNAYTYSDTPLS